MTHQDIADSLTWLEDADDEIEAEQVNGFTIKKPPITIVIKGR